MVAERVHTTQQGTLIDYWPLGGARDLWYAKERQVLLEGPAGTGKTIACLNKIHRAATRYPGMRGLIARKTQVSLRASALVTYQRKVLHPLDAVRFYGGSQADPAKFIYPNGSEIMVGGLDQSSKIMSTEYDMIYPNEATELTEDDWESLDTRLRNYVMPYQQLMADCNPGPPAHWLNQRCNVGRTRRILSRHEDNPFYFDPKTGELTKEGREYITGLDGLSGVRYKRLRLGKWAAAEGQVYEAFDPAVHVVERTDLAMYGLAEPKRVIAAVDWGWTNPGVITVGAIGGDDQIGVVREVYRSRKDRDWWIATARALRTEFAIDLFVCDPSEPEYIDAWKRAGLPAEPATNDILPGITALQTLLAPDANGRPKFVVVRDCNVSPDLELQSEKRPTSGLQEVESYVWAVSPVTGKKEKPVDADNHALDSWRYLVLAANAPSRAMWKA